MIQVHAHTPRIQELYLINSRVARKRGLWAKRTFDRSWVGGAPRRL